jgi:hypothetical protein
MIPEDLLCEHLWSTSENSDCAQKRMQTAHASMGAFCCVVDSFFAQLTDKLN